MTAYLIDENVFREFWDGGDPRVVAWYSSINEADLRISAITLFEKRRGWELRRRRDPELAKAKLAELDVLDATLGSRLIPIDGAVAAEWARLVGLKDKNRNDRALAATARVHGLILVTRNVADVRGCGVRVLDPFRKGPKIETV